MLAEYVCIYRADKRMAQLRAESGVDFVGGGDIFDVR